MRRLALFASICTGLVVSAVPAFAGPLGQPVRATPEEEIFPAAEGGFVAWMTASLQTQNDDFDVMVKPPGRPAFQANAADTSAALGGIDGTRLVYQQFKGSQSDLKFVNLETRRRSNPPDGVNTAAWEFWPSLDGDLLLLGRIGSGEFKLILFNLDTGAKRVLDEFPQDNRQLQPGQVNGNFVAWGRSSRSVCDVLVYDVELDRQTKVPNPGSKCQFGPSVSADGTVYYGRGGFGCGLNSELRRYPVGGPAQTLQEMPEGIEFDDTYVVDGPQQKDTVFYDPGGCEQGQDQDIFKKSFA